MHGVHEVAGSSPVIPTICYPYSMEKWLEIFRSFWLQKDVESVLSLFTDDVEYWETPFQQLHTKDEIRQAWGQIIDHDIEELHFTIQIADVSNKQFAIDWLYKRSQHEWK